MLTTFTELNPAIQAILATCFTWGMTALGAGSVYLAREVNRKLLDAMLGFAGGVMIAASYWSLLAPAIEMSTGKAFPAWLPGAAGFLAGGVFLAVTDKILPHLHRGLRLEEAEGIKTSWQRSILLIMAITLHNIPEGLAIGVAFGAVTSDFPSATLSGAIALAIGIGIQNLPEGLAVAMPLRGEGLSRGKSFFYGQLSGIVEPFAALLGAVAVVLAQPILPFALGFAAGAMIFVVVEELVPESHNAGNRDLATMGTMLGFSVMMVLDVAFA